MNIREQIYTYLQHHGPTDRQDIVNNLHIPRTTVYDNLFSLAQNHKVQKYPQLTHKRGRPRILWKTV